MFIDTTNPVPMAGECQARPAARAFQITTYQDHDPLGRGQWFATHKHLNSPGPASHAADRGFRTSPINNH